MSLDRATPPKPLVGEVFLRLVAWVLLLGGLLAGLAWLGLLGLPRAEHLGEPMFVVPGTGGHRFIQPVAALVVGAAALALTLVGLATLGLQRWAGRRMPAVLEGSPLQAVAPLQAATPLLAVAPRPVSARPRPASPRRRRPALLLGAGLLALVAALAIRWGSAAPIPSAIGQPSVIR